MGQGFNWEGRGTTGAFKAGRKHKGNNQAEFQQEEAERAMEANPAPPCLVAGLHGAHPLFQVSEVMNQQSDSNPQILEVSPCCRGLVTHQLHRFQYVSKVVIQSLALPPHFQPEQTYGHFRWISFFFWLSISPLSPRHLVFKRSSNIIFLRLHFLWLIKANSFSSLKK